MNYFPRDSYNLMKICFVGVKVLSRKRKRERAEKHRIPMPEPLSSAPKIEMLGNKEIIVDGCKGIVEYGENLIKLNTGELVIGFVGDEMLIKSFDSDMAVITGRIAEITFVS